MECFNSRDKKYKSIISAIPTEYPLFLRICLSRNICCTGARLVVRKENEIQVSYGMFWAGMEGEDHEWWNIHFAPTTSGLYWYCFEFDTPWGTGTIKNFHDGIGEINSTGSEFQLTVYEKGFETPDWLKQGLIYQIFPDRFASSVQKKIDVPTDRILRKDWGGMPMWKPDENGKMLNNDYFCGDLKGIEAKLGYLKRLGVTCIYLNPIFEAHSNHRYDTGDYSKIDPLLGSEDDFKSLCSKAKAKGIRVVLDGVFSHTGCDSVYFNMYNRYPGNGAYNSKESPYFSWYKFIEFPNKYKSWWGIELLPEINEDNNDFQEFICGKGGILQKWIENGASGWRLDVADELPDIFLDNVRQAVKTKNRNAVIIGEVWENATTKSAYGERRRYLLGNQLDSVMNYPFSEGILNFVRYGNGEFLFDKIMKIIENYPPQVLNVLMNHIGTHDTERAITRLAGEPCDGHDREWQQNRVLSKDEYNHGKKMLKLASALQYTLPGVPSLYYGDEIGMEGYRDPFNRVCFDWENGDRELLNWYVRLGQIRAGCSAFYDGELVVIYKSTDTVCFSRQGENSSALIGINRGNTDENFSVPKHWENAYNVIGSLPFREKLELKPMSVTILTR